MRQIAAVLFLFLSSSHVSAATWRDDVRAFARELPKRHAAAFHRVSREDFAAAIAALDAKAATATDSVMFVELSRISASIGDGHTYVQIPATARRLGIAVQPFGEEWRVTHTSEAHKSALGMRAIKSTTPPSPTRCNSSSR